MSAKSSADRSRCRSPMVSGVRAVMSGPKTRRARSTPKAACGAAADSMTDGKVTASGLLGRGDGQALAAACATSGQHGAAALRLHAGAKTVRLLAVAIAGSVCALHRRILWRDDT